MKILHISTYDRGGAGLSCIRLHKGLLKNGYDSKVLVLEKSFNEPEVYRYEEKIIHPKIFRWLINFVLLVLRKLKIPISRALYYQYKLNKFRLKYDLVYSLPVSEYDISNHPLVKDADIIHLQWVAGFLDYPSFFKNVKKPIIWTLHDENLNYGGFHYRSEQIKHAELFTELEEQLKRIKGKSIDQCPNLTFVSLSNMMSELSESNRIVKNRKNYIIHNSVDHNVFRPFDKKICRDIYNLPQNKKIILFVSYYLDDKQKGFIELIQALHELNLVDLAICAVGIGKPEIETSLDIYYQGVINDQRMLSLAYSASDIFVTPSFQEAFAQAPLEAMACGLPVVSFPCSGTIELINDKNGVRTTDFTIDALKEGILKALETEYDGEWIRQDIISRFQVNKIVNQYVEIYKDCLGLNQLENQALIR